MPEKDKNKETKKYVIKARNLKHRVKELKKNASHRTNSKSY